MEIHKGGEIRVVQISAAAKIGADSWMGVGFWPEPTDTAGWSALISNVAMAFATSLEQTGGLLNLKRWEMGGRSCNLRGIAYSQYKAKWEGVPLDSPMRIVWEPMKTVRFGLGGGGANG